MSKMIELDVPYEEKDEAKALGATWVVELRKWVIPANARKKFERWLPYEPLTEQQLADIPLLNAEPEHVHFVESIAQACKFPEWMLLMISHDEWGAFWREDLDGPAAIAVANGDYHTGCRFLGRRPEAVLNYMRENRLYAGQPLSRSEVEPEIDLNDDYEPEPELDDFPFCTAELRIGDHSIAIQLPAHCERLIEHVPEEAQVAPPYSELAQAVHEYLDQNAAAAFRLPSADRLDLALSFSQKLRVPFPRDIQSNMLACEDFISKHAAAFTLYSVIRRDVTPYIWALGKLAANYSRWDIARKGLENGVHWSVLADELGVKKEATVTKYAAQAIQAEQENPELTQNDLCVAMIDCLRKGHDIDFAVATYTDEIAFGEFIVQHRARCLLKAKSANR